MQNIINLNSGQTIDVLYQDEVSLDIDCALRYIKSGQQEIQDYVDLVSKKQLNTLIEQTKEELDQKISIGVDEAAKAAEAAADKSISDVVVAVESEIDEYVAQTINPELDAKVEISSVNAALAESSAEEASLYNFRKNITNCITKMPQNIKYAVTGNVLSIKAGSKVYFPYGVTDLSSAYPRGAVFLNSNFVVDDTYYEDGKFYVGVIVQNDTTMASASQASTNRRMVTFSAANGKLASIEAGAYLSGAAEPSGLGGSARFFNTTTNYIYNAGTTTYHSFPLVVGQTTNGTGWTKIDQVFNGLGYIGSAVFVLPEVEGLVPNGRNDDGSLNNVVLRFGAPAIFSFADTDNFTVATGRILAQPNNVLLLKAGGYDAVNNYLTASNGSILTNRMVVCSVACENGVVKELQPRLVFHAADYSEVAKLGVSNLFDGANTFTQVISAPAVRRSNDAGDIVDVNLAVPDGATIWSQLRAKRGDEATCWIGIGATTSGVSTTYAPNPAVGSNSTQIATTAWVNSFCKTTNKLVVETYQNGDSWYRVWSDGWIEQGGTTETGTGQLTVNLLKPFADSHYSLMCTANFSSATAISYISKTTTSFTAVRSANTLFAWVAKGYGA